MTFSAMIGAGLGAMVGGPWGAVAGAGLLPWIFRSSGRRKTA